jgi:hypothetical protein
MGEEGVNSVVYGGYCVALIQDSFTGGSRSYWGFNCVEDGDNVNFFMDKEALDGKLIAFMRRDDNATRNFLCRREY